MLHRRYRAAAAFFVPEIVEAEQPRHGDAPAVGVEDPFGIDLEICIRIEAGTLVSHGEDQPFGPGLDFDGPGTPPPQLGRLYLDQVGIFPGSLGNFGGVHKGMPVVTIGFGGTLAPGTPVRLVRRADVGGVLEIEVRGSRLSLRRGEARELWFEAPR